MAAKIILAFVTVLACFASSTASPTRRQIISISETTSSEPSVTDDGTVWDDDNDDFDLDGDGWFSQAPILSSTPAKSQDFDEYDDDYARGNAMLDIDDDDDEEEEEGDEVQDAEEADENGHDSEFMFVPPRDTRLVLEDDDDDQSGPIKVRHTGRSSYSHVSVDDGDNSVESAEDDNEHPYEFAIDEDDDDSHTENDNVSVVVPRKAQADDDDSEVDLDDDDDDDFLNESDDDDSDSDVFEDPQEDAAQVIYGDHVFLY